MTITPGQQRKAQRAVHLVVAGLLFLYVYAPPMAGLVYLTRWVAFPTLILTGLVMWQAPRIRRVLKRRRTGKSRVASGLSPMFGGADGGHP